jgi:hypothetical protein
MRLACELLDQCRNKRIVVAYGVADKMVPGDSIMGHHLPIEYYTRVFVDQMVNVWADLELEIPRPNREEIPQDTVHTWIFLPKTYIRITQPTTSPPAKSLTSPATMHEGQDQLPASLAARAECNMSHVVDRDQSESPPTSPPPSPHVKGKGTKRQAPPPPPPKK